MHRSQCEIFDRRKITKILASTHIGRLATLGADGYPYITPVNFVFYKSCVYFHCATVGMKLDNIIRDPRVCFEVDVPLAYLGVGFNPERNPCDCAQLYHCVIIRGKARVLSDGNLKTSILNALVAKHEGNTNFTPITSDFPSYRTCHVLQIKPEKLTAKSNLAQSKPEKLYHRFIAENLVERGLPGDLEAVRAMGYGLERCGKGWRMKKKSVGFKEKI